MHQVNCADMVEPEFDYETKQAQLSGSDAQYEDYEQDLSSMYIYTIAED